MTMPQPDLSRASADFAQLWQHISASKGVPAVLALAPEQDTQFAELAAAVGEANLDPAEFAFVADVLGIAVKMVQAVRAAVGTPAEG
jgi:hypothetical protein